MAKKTVKLAELNEPLTTTEEILVVTETKLPPGKYHFQLDVEDDAGNRSATPAIQEVIVRDTLKPTAVLDGPDAPIGVGETFELSGARSSDQGGGKVTKYIWNMVKPADVGRILADRERVLRDVVVNPVVTPRPAPTG